MNFAHNEGKNKALYLKSTPKLGIVKGGKESRKWGENHQSIQRVENYTLLVPFL